MRSSYGVSISNLLHLTDFSQGSGIAYVHALRIAVAVKGSLEILHIQQEEEHATWDRYPGVRDTLCKWKLLPAEAERGDVAKLGVHISKAACQAKEPIQGVLDHLERRDADLVVMATHRRGGLDRWLHDSIAESLSDATETGALLIPYDVDGFVDSETGEVTLRRILVPVDFAPDPQPVISAVAELVEAIAPHNVEIRLLHVGDRARTPTLMLPGSDTCVWNWGHREGYVVDAICNDALENDVDLIAMTTNGHDGFLDALRGSTTDRVLHRTQCPLLSIHSGSNE